MQSKKLWEEQNYYKWSDESFFTDRIKKLVFELINHLNTKIAKNVLDVGSGTGDLIYRLAKKYTNNSYFGCDISESVIKQNIISKPEITWSVKDLNNATDFKSDFFDIIIAGEIIEHLYNSDLFILEMSRILKPSGLLFITTPNLASWLDRVTLLFGLQPFCTEVSNISRKFGRENFYKLLRSNADSPSVGHIRCFTRSALLSFLRYYKFTVVKEIPCYHHEFLLNKFITKILPSLAQQLFVIARKKHDNF
ncbi:MAG: class I SAM-dependent methyltransferase [Planctomycetia bacterium]|nr:class I SAM-dependent methyltransferase [Planctomycetia bacterium]